MRGPCSRPSRTRASVASTRTPRSPSRRRRGAHRRRSPDRVDRHRPHVRAARARGGRLRRTAGRARRSPRRRPPRRTAPSWSSSTTSRSRRSSTSRRRWQPGAALARVVEESDDEGGDLESIHAEVDKGQEDDAGEQLSGNVLDRVTRERGDVAAAFAASDAVVEGTFRTPWVYQAYIEPQVCTAWLEPSGDARRLDEHAGLVRHAPGAGAARSTSRWSAFASIAEPLGGAFGGKFALVEPLAVGAALALRRPVRLVLTRSEDFAADEPGLGAGHAPQGRRPRRTGRFTAIEARMIVDRGTNAGWGVEGSDVAARRRAVPLAGPRPARLRRADESLHVRRLPRARRADGRVRARVAPRRARAEARPRPDRAAPEERRGRGRRRRERKPVSHHRRRRGPRAAPGAPAVGRSATRCRTTKAVGMAAGHWPGGNGARRRPSAGSTPTGR